jgi:inorganic pyrophosphatase
MPPEINATHYENIDTFAGDRKRIVHAIIETPRNQRHKYAFDPKTGAFRQSMTLEEGLQWPYDYGFIPQTLAPDGDSIDILFLGDEPTFTGCLVQARVIGIVFIKKNGKENDRILGCPLHQKGLHQKADSFDEVDDVPKDTIESMCRYLVEYSQAEGNELEFRGTGSRKAALKSIARARKAFQKDQTKRKVK